MRILHLMLLCHASLQLQCDKTTITAYIGGEFILKCKYDVNKFRYNKKYWCLGESMITCEILSDSETKNTRRILMWDAGFRGLFVKVTDLQLHDSGLYWVGIDKIYADRMLAVKVTVQQAPVSKPSLMPQISPTDRPSCWGKSVMVRCNSKQGSQVQYLWYRQTPDKPLLLHTSSDLVLDCGTVGKDSSSYYCTARNQMSSQDSDVLSVQALVPGDNTTTCIYVLHIHGRLVYGCGDRLSTESVTERQQEQQNSRPCAGLPPWYLWLRWGLFVALLVALFVTQLNVRRAPPHTPAHP